MKSQDKALADSPSTCGSNGAYPQCLIQLPVFYKSLAPQSQDSEQEKQRQGHGALSLWPVAAAGLCISPASPAVCPRFRLYLHLGTVLNKKTECILVTSGHDSFYQQAFLQPSPHPADPCHCSTVPSRAWGAAGVSACLEDRSLPHEDLLFQQARPVGLGSSTPQPLGEASPCQISSAAPLRGGVFLQSVSGASRYFQLPWPRA